MSIPDTHMLRGEGSTNTVEMVSTDATNYGTVEGTVAVWSDNDVEGSTLHVHIEAHDTDRMIVVELNDGPRLYAGRTDHDDSPAQILHDIAGIIAEERQVGLPGDLASINAVDRIERLLRDRRVNEL